MISGKRVLELGAGSGLASINAAKLGASIALATDRDADVRTLEAALRSAFDLRLFLA